ncbi:MAG: hypothetical protein ACJ77K_03400 [Bacteroidia bacterium]
MIIPENIRKFLIPACRKALDQRVGAARNYLDTVNESVNDETKSTAGDKHETGRAMAQIEQEKAQKQLNEATRMQDEFLRLSTSSGSASNIISISSIVLTDKQHFFISVPLGSVQTDYGTFQVISPVSPIGKMMLGRREGEKLEFNGNTFVIEKVL